MAANPVERLQILINSSSPLVIIETVEEERALLLCRQAAYNLSLPFFEWSVADGLVRNDSRIKPVQAAPSPMATAQLMNYLSPSDQLNGTAAPGSIVNTKEPDGLLAHLLTMTIESVFVLKDFHRHLENASVIRRLREVAQLFSNDRRTMILIAPSMALPPELLPMAEYLDLPLPDRQALSKVVEDTFSRLSKKMSLKRTLDAAQTQQLVGNLCGLTESEAERAVASAVVTRYALCPEIITDVLDAKKEALRRTGMLDFVPPQENLSAVGGLENMKAWLHKRQGSWEDAARAAGLEPPKGVIILGVQGCGKSMCARAIAGEWKIPLVKFDAASIFDKWVGETEKHLRKTLQICEQLAPCVLWIDELEKVFAGSGPDSASSDAGTASRLLGAFLSWMSDRKAPVFVAATCNNVTALPPELIRKGRFDEIFFVDLPKTSERRDIFTVHLSKRKMKPAEFDLEALVAASEGFSGAEIESAIKSGQYSAYADKKFMTTEVVLNELRNTVPLSRTRAEEIDELREWAAKRAVPASTPDETTDRSIAASHSSR